MHIFCPVDFDELRRNINIEFIIEARSVYLIAADRYEVFTESEYFTEWLVS